MESIQLVENSLNSFSINAGDFINILIDKREINLLNKIHWSGIKLAFNLGHVCTMLLLKISTCLKTKIFVKFSQFQNSHF